MDYTSLSASKLTLGKPVSLSSSIADLNAAGLAPARDLPRLATLLLLTSP